MIWAGIGADFLSLCYKSMTEAERSIEFTQNGKDADNSLHLCAYLFITLISLPFQLQAHCKPIVRLSQVCHKSIANHLLTHCKPTVNLSQAHCKSLAGSLQARCPLPVVTSLQDCCKLIVNLLRAPGKPVASLLLMHCKPVVRPLQAHSQPTSSLLQACCKPICSPSQSQQQGKEEPWKRGWDQRNPAAPNLAQLISQPGLPSLLVPVTRRLQRFRHGSVLRITTTAPRSQSPSDPPHCGRGDFPPSRGSRGSLISHPGSCFSLNR